MISVIVPAYNAAATIDDCLSALQVQGVEREAVEIIVVDDGSIDDTADRAQRFGVKLIRCPHNRGAAAARNQGIHVAAGEIICFTDADCVPQPNWLEEVTRPLRQDAGITAVKGIYISHQPQLVARFVQLEYEDKYGGMAAMPHIDFVDTYSCAYRRQVLLDNNGFDETIAYVEDQELSFRLAAQGYRMLFQPTAVVAHRHSASLRQYARKKFWIGYWKARFIRRYPDRVIKDSHTPQILKVQMGLAGLMVATAVSIPLFPLMLWPLLFLLFLFVTTTLPFCRKAWAKDHAVALAAPFLLFTRALALGLGFAWGTGAIILSKATH
jgi:glycosyltransferase involved in cell wall biosynthesis